MTTDKLVAMLIMGPEGFRVDLCDGKLSVGRAEDGQYAVHSAENPHGPGTLEFFGTPLTATRRFMELRRERRLGYDLGREAAAKSGGEGGATGAE